MDGSKGAGIGARVPRLEDDRYLRGRGKYIGDIKLSGMKEVAFLRSPVAHGRIRGFDIPENLRSQVTIAADMDGVKAIRAVTALPGFNVSEQPALATDKVRYVGELVAMCLAPDRAKAEDIVQQISVGIEELTAIHDMVQARDAGTPLIHEQWNENVFLESVVDDPKFDEIAAKAPVKVTRTFRTARQCMSPIEGRGVVAEWDSRLEQLTVFSASQMPHIVRTGLSECLGLDHGKVRIIAPDVGGGFGYKGILLPEEVAICWLAMQVRHPVRWIEDRREQL
ncbi:MAG: molybdopterin cofactor-binding domain-containing protein, partial [Pseudomonadota bacterium]|nr:molybdopterin cofactor-binding domain-containing protein [Pseudomonadota bacterium]